MPRTWRVPSLILQLVQCPDGTSAKDTPVSALRFSLDVFLRGVLTPLINYSPDEL